MLSSRVLVATDDLQASVAWWCDTLGLSVAREYGADGVVTGVALFCGGVVTSGNFSPVLEHGIALALCDPAVAVGDSVQIDMRGTLVDAEVVKLPFVAKAS